MQFPGLTARRGNFRFKAEERENMADNIPTSPGGATPRTGWSYPKCSRKKETVRINLPPKPTVRADDQAADVGKPGVAGIYQRRRACRHCRGRPRRTGAAAKAPRGGVVRRAVSATPSARFRRGPRRPNRRLAPALRPMAPVAVSGLRGLDKGLAIAAAVASVAALGCVLYLAYFLKDIPPS